MIKVKIIKHEIFLFGSEVISEKNIGYPSTYWLVIELRRPLITEYE